MRPSISDDPFTGTEIFQVDDRSLDYLERLVDFDELEFERLDSGFDPREILQIILGGVA
jgi:hypothetical protein